MRHISIEFVLFSLLKEFLVQRHRVLDFEASKVFQDNDYDYDDDLQGEVREGDDT